MKTIKLNNKGHFYFHNLLPREANPGADSSKCGYPDGSVYSYEVELVGTVEVLDKSTCFILDVDAIDAFFKLFSKNTDPITMSCEEMALFSLDKIIDLVTRKENLKYVRVRISPTLYSYFDAEYRSGK